MKKETILVANISNKIQRVLRKEGLKPKISPADFIKETQGTKHRYYSICTRKDKEKIIFYARVQNNKTAKKKVRKETIFANLINKESFRKKIPFLEFLPRYYKGKIEKDFEWFEREFLRENPLGDNEFFKKDLTRRQISEITKFLVAFLETKISSFKEVPLGEFPLKNYEDIPVLLKPLYEENIISKKYFAQAKDFFKKYFSLFRKEHKYFSHGDFNLGNIIFTKKGLKVIDWESMEINNFAYDIAYLFCHLWQARQWQRKYLITNFLYKTPINKRKSFKILLRGDLVFLGGGGFWAEPEEVKKSQLNKRKKFFCELIKSSLESFEKVLMI